MSTMPETNQITKIAPIQQLPDVHRYFFAGGVQRAGLSAGPLSR